MARYFDSAAVDSTIAESGIGGKLKLLLTVSTSPLPSIFLLKATIFVSFPKPAGEKTSMGLERTSLRTTAQNGTFWPETG